MRTKTPARCVGVNLTKSPMKQKIQIVETQEGLLPPPREFFGYWFMDMWIDAEPVGIDPLTGHSIYWGDKHEIACLLKDKPNDDDIPF